MKKKKQNLVRCKDPDIASLLDQGDKFLYRKQKTTLGVIHYEWIEYILHKKPVFMKHSYNWTFRAMMLTGKNKDLIEYLYLNDLTIHEFKFNEITVLKFKKEKQLKDL